MNHYPQIHKNPLALHYPPIPQELLVSYGLNQNLRDYAEIVLERDGIGEKISHMFEVQEVYPGLDRPEGRREILVATSLFYKHPDLPGEVVPPGDQIPMEWLTSGNGSPKEAREKKNFMELYFHPLFDSARSYSEKFDFRVYLANDLQCLVPMLRERGVEVFLMKSSSVAHNPGSMWRFLADQDRGYGGYEAVYSADSDVEFQVGSIERALMGAISDPEVSLARPLNNTNKEGELALILGNRFMWKPWGDLFGPVRATMEGMIVMAILHGQQGTLFSHQSQNRVMHDGALFGMGFPRYGFDEVYLKHFVYWMAACDGSMATLVCEQHLNPKDQLQSLDLQFCRSMGCPETTYL